MIRLTQAPSHLSNFLINWVHEYKKDTLDRTHMNSTNETLFDHPHPYFKNIKIKDIKPIMCKNFLNYLTSQGYSNRTVRKHTQYDV